MNPFFSIITPVYNCEKFIKKCIESVIYQTYTNFELILVNDGSTDNSGQICNHYAKEDSRIRVNHKHNEGVSCARNDALNIARGEYILFLDSDDYLAHETLETCNRLIEKNKLDILQFSLSGVNENGETFIKKSTRKETTQVLNSFEYINNGNYLVCAGGSCIKRSIIESNNIRFCKEIKLAEDQLFILTAIINAKKIQFYNRKLYFYLDNINSSSNNCKTNDIKMSISKITSFVKRNPCLEDHFNSLLLDFILKLIKNNDIKPKDIKLLLYKTKFKYHNSLTKGCKLFCILSKLNFTFACIITRFVLNIK